MANLINLSGSEKQVEWAIKVREKLVAALEADLAQLVKDLAHKEANYPSDVPASQAALDTATAGLTKILTQDSAGWWIDRRSDSARNLLAEAAVETTLETAAASWWRGSQGGSDALFAEPYPLTDRRAGKWKITHASFAMDGRLCSTSVAGSFPSREAAEVALDTAAAELGLKRKLARASRSKPLKKPQPEETDDAIFQNSPNRSRS